MRTRRNLEPVSGPRLTGWWMLLGPDGLVHIASPMYVEETGESCYARLCSMMSGDSLPLSTPATRIRGGWRMEGPRCPLCLADWKDGYGVGLGGR